MSKIIVTTRAEPETPSTGKATLYIDSGTKTLRSKNDAGVVTDYTSDTGEVNTASNVGTAGVGVFKQKTGTDLEFKKINAGSNKITITDDTVNSEVDIDVNPANISHTAIADIGTNTHAQIDTHIAATSGAHGISNFGATLIDDASASDARTTLGVVIGTNVQAQSATLDSFATYNTNGLITQTSANTFTGRTLTGTADQVTVTNGSGVAGNPTLSLPQSIATTSTPQFAKLGIGTAATTTDGIACRPMGMTGVTQSGMLFAPTFTSAATSNGIALSLQCITEAASFNTSIIQGLLINAPSFGAGSTASNVFGIRILDQSGGSTLSCGVIAGVSSGTGKWNFYVNGTAPNYFNGGIQTHSGTALGKLESRATSGSQIIASYDASNYLGIGVGSSGAVTFDAVGSGANLLFNENVKINTVGSGLYVKEGTNATMGSATLVAGTVTVSTTKVTANSRIFLTAQDGTTNLGSLGVSARTAGTSFTILSSDGADVRSVAWMIVEPA